MQKRKVEIVVISDTHLGTYGCHAKELLLYLKTIQPEILILNGDIIDGWNFSKSYFPKEHFAVIKKIMKFLASGTKVYYLTGNHDEFLRRFSGFTLGNFFLTDKMLLSLNGQKTWIFHGDVFDTSITCGKWLAKLGGSSYDLLIRLNKTINNFLEWVGMPRMSLSKRVKDSVKRAVKYVSDFEQIAAEIAIEKKYDFVICGHIHHPQIRHIVTSKGSVQYLNSGDWIENLSALEYDKGKWTLYHYPQNETTEESDKQFNQLILELYETPGVYADSDFVQFKLG